MPSPVSIGAELIDPGTDLASFLRIFGTSALLNNTILAIQPKEGKKKEKKPHML